MLISFSIENAYSFKDEITLDMQATSIKAHGYSLLKVGDYKLLPVSAIYGANSSGKSNLIHAMGAILWSVQGDPKLTVSPFMLLHDEIINPLTRAELRFIVKQNENDDSWVECIYTLHASTSLYSIEELQCIPPGKKSKTMIYRRKWDEESDKWVLEVGASTYVKSLFEEISYVHDMEPNRDTLLLTALGKRARHALFNQIFLWVNSSATFKERTVPDVGLPYVSEMDYVVPFIKNKETYIALNNFIRIVNPLIDNVSLIESSSYLDADKRFEMIADSKSYYLFLEYKNKSSDKEKCDFIMSSSESKGVWTAMYLFPLIYSVLSNGGLLIIDEMENSLHPLMMAKIINMFTSPETNPGKGQLIFTTHNALLMDKMYFRQDEIVFVDKNNVNGFSTVYRLSDIEGVRSDLDFCKNYIYGSFGALPELVLNEDDSAYEK